MRRVWITRAGLLPVVFLLAASFVFLGGSSEEAEASAFNPTLAATLGSNGAGATANINETADWGSSPILDPDRAFPASSVYFTPNGWNIPDCSPTGACPYANGVRTGEFGSTTTFGILNSECAIPAPVGFPDGMRNASTDPNDPQTMHPNPNNDPTNPFINLFEDDGDLDEDGTVDDPAIAGNGVPDGGEHWNTLLAGLVAVGILPPDAPRERQFLNTLALGTTPVWVDVLTYNPGQIGGPATAPLGFATIFVLQNANPLNPPAPSIISDTCGLSNSFTQSGMAANGATHRTNPATPGTKLFGLNSESGRDADVGPSAPTEPTVFDAPVCGPGGTQPCGGFGQVNSIDTCPYTPNVGSVLTPFGQPLDGDDDELPGDGIDEACDPDPFDFTPGGSNKDGDSYLNRGDNCPFVPNGTAAGETNQRDQGELGPPVAPEVGQQPVDGGGASDSIGDVCDVNPTVADGHAHEVLNLTPICVTGGPFSDGDGDGWCDVEELALGGSTTGTPETLSVPNSCSDGADNDLDGNSDLNDSACQLPLHDLSIRRLNGPARVPCAGSTEDYTLLLRNSASADSGEISIYLDSQPPYVPAYGETVTAGKSAGAVVGVTGGTITSSGPINIDGDVDVEWLTKAVVSVKASPATTDIGIQVSFPASAACEEGTTDFTVTADVCHGNDIAPLGVNPLFAACAASLTSDGGQDNNPANDAPVTKNIDAEPGAGP